jgi:glycosyltransferase involved in cell wall biosynthesis
MLCSVVLPIHNESENIISMFEEITNVFNTIEHDFEIVFIDDGSDDSSWEMIQNLTSQPHVQGI